MTESLQGIDNAIMAFREQLEDEVVALQPDDLASTEVLSEDQVTAEDLDQLMAKVKLLLESGDPARFRGTPELSVEDWVCLAAFWINHINAWSEYWPILKLSGILNGLVQQMARRWIASQANQPADVDEQHKNLLDDSPAEVFKETEVYLKVLTPAIKRLLGALPVYPWERDWLLPEAISSIKWVAGAADWISFARYDYELLMSSDSLSSSLTQLLSTVDIQMTETQRYRFYIENWLFRHDFHDVVFTEINNENEAAGSTAAVNNLRIRTDEIEVEDEPDEELLAAMEAAALDGMGPGSFDIPASELASDINDLEKLLAEVGSDEGAEVGIPDQVKTNPFLLKGKFPETLADGFRIYDHGLLQLIGESLLIEADELDSLSKDDLIEKLLVEIPKRLRIDLRIYAGTNVTLLHHLLERNGALVSYDRAMMVNDLIEKGFIFLLDRPSGYRIYIPNEVKAVLHEKPLAEMLDEAKVFSMVSEVATALVNWRGVAKIEDVVDVINSEYHVNIKQYSFGELRRLIRNNLELHETEQLAAFRFRRPYIYNDTLDYETALLISELAETSNVTNKRLTAKDIHAAVTPPFSVVTDKWLHFLSLIEDDIDSLDWDLQEEVVYYLAQLTAQETDLNIIVELLTEMEVDIEDVKHLELVLRAYSDYANTSPIWRLGGHSLNELNMAKSYEDRMTESIEHYRQSAPGDDHLAEHDHDHDHHHGHHHH